MILCSLKLENIRSYTNEEIVFPEGSVLLSGDIGSGKSTILLGIEFALFGIMRSGLSGTSLLRHGCSQGSVELKFEIGKDEYVIKRVLKKSRNSVSQDAGYILVNGRKHEGTPVELKSKILDILGYPADLLTRSKSLIYRYTVYTAQEQMKEILFEEKDIRLDTLRKLFGIDKYKTIRENSVLFIRELKRKTSELEIKFEQHDEYENSKKLSNEKLKELVIEIKEKNNSLNSVKQKLTEQKKLTEKFEEGINEYDELKKKSELKNMIILSKTNEKENLVKKTTESNIEKLKNNLKEFSEIHELKSEKQLEENLERKQLLHSRLIKEKSITFEKISQLENNIKEVEEQIKIDTKEAKQEFALKSKLEELKVIIDKRKKQEFILDNFVKKDKEYSINLEKNNMIIQDSKDLVESMKTQDFCPKCKQEITDEHKQRVIYDENQTILEKQEQKEKTKKVIEAIESNIEKLKKNLDKISEFEKQYQQTKESLIKIQSTSSLLVEKQKHLSKMYSEKQELEIKSKTFDETSLIKEINELKKELSKIRENNQKFREKKNIIETIDKETKYIESLKNDIIKIDLQISESYKEIEKIKNILEKSSDLIENYQKNKELLENFRQNEKQLEISLSALNQEHSTIIKGLEEINQKIKSLDLVKQKINTLKEMRNWFDSFFVKLMSTMEKHIMISIHREFNSLLKEWFSILIEDIDVSLDDEFVVNLVQDGYESDLDSLSGGEKTSVALAYRLALNKVVNELIPTIKTKDLIILDEPTDGFSSEQLDKVREVIVELNMKQTIIVSHEPKMESYVENIVRIAKNDGVSRVV